MKIKRIDTTYNTEKLQESKSFYMEYFGFELAFESDWYIELVTPDRSAGISFTMAVRDTGEFFNGNGVIISFEVDDVDKEYDKLVQAGLMISQTLQNKPWGERSFVVDDPNGLHVYVYTLIEPTPEYREQYAKFQ